MPMTSYEVSRRFTQLSFAEIAFLKRLVGCLPEGATFVNIGAGHGTSALAVLEARPDLHIVTVDVRENHPTGSLMGEKNTLHDWVEMGVFAYPTQILSDSIEAGRNWTGGEVDAVFIDGDHTEPGCRGDWEAWMPHIKQGGIVIFHDYKCIYGPGVEAVVIDVEKEHELIGVVDTLIAFRIRDGSERI